MTQTTAIRAERHAAFAYLFLAVGLLAVSMAAIFIRLAQAEGVPSLLIAASRLTLASLALTPFVLTNTRHRQQIRSLSRFDLLLVVVAGIFLALHFATWVTSLEYTSVLISVVLVTTTPIWVALLEVLVLRAKMTRYVVLGLVIAFAGGVMIGLGGSESSASANDRSTWIGGALSLAGAVTVAVYLIAGRRVRPSLALTPYIWMVYGTAAIALLCIVALRGIPLAGYSPGAYLLMIGLAVFPQLIGHTSYNYALAYLPATMVSIVSMAEPIGSAIIALLVFAEIPTRTQLLGSIIILVGVLTATLFQANFQQKSEE
ncbi:MAG: DMT family transporter [bacterium]|nr:DMT family transporter [bacterium]